MYELLNKDDWSRSSFKGFDYWFGELKYCDVWYKVLVIFKNKFMYIYLIVKFFIKGVILFIYILEWGVIVCFFVVWKWMFRFLFFNMIVLKLKIK